MIVLDVAGGMAANRGDRDGSEARHRRSGLPAGRQEQPRRSIGLGRSPSYVVRFMELPIHELGFRSWPAPWPTRAAR